MKLVNDDSNVIGVTTKEGFFTFWCSGCGCGHSIYTNPDKYGNYWYFNNDLKKPTFVGHLKKQAGSPEGTYRDWALTSGKPMGTTQPEYYCEFRIDNGIITYSKRSTHILSGMATEMRERKDWGGMKFTALDDKNTSFGFKIYFEV